MSVYTCKSSRQRFPLAQIDESRLRCRQRVHVGTDSKSRICGERIPFAVDLLACRKRAVVRCTMSNCAHVPDNQHRNTLDVSKLWISRRILMAESALLRIYGGIAPMIKAQDAIRQGRSVRMRCVTKRIRYGTCHSFCSPTFENNHAIKPGCPL